MALVQFFEIWYRITPAPLSFYLVLGLDDGTAMIVDTNGFVQLAHPPGYDEARDWLVQKDFRLVDSVMEQAHPDFAALVSALPRPVTKDGQPVMEPVHNLVFYSDVFASGCVRSIILYRVFKGGNVNGISLDRDGRDWAETSQLLQCGCNCFDPLRQTHWDHIWEIIDMEGYRVCYGRNEFDPGDEPDVNDFLEPDY